MKRQLAALTLGMLLLSPAAGAAELTLDGTLLHVGKTPLYNDTTYVPLRAVTQALRPDAQVDWTDGQAVITADGLTLTARPGQNYLTCNGLKVNLCSGVRLEDGRTLVPIRPLAAALGASTDWEAATGAVRLSTGISGDLYWLSRIISAESQGEPLAGKIAVGNVVLNRVKSADFPNSIYGVIFDDRWGGQFEPVRNGTIYHDPTEESVLAARLCLAGANTAGNSFYFLAPALTSNHWTMNNRSYVTTIGAHWFYE